MVRRATAADAEQLRALNAEFNGVKTLSVESVRASLLHNQQEIVIVAEEDGVLAGFVCVQLKKSFCYAESMSEITEVYVRPAYRRRAIASAMLAFAEEYCRERYPLGQFELLTGDDNFAAQGLYGKLGYAKDGEIHLVKEIER